MAEVDYWSKTAAELQPFFDTPVLTEKLLKRPPFRFIHDIVCQLQIRYQVFGMTFSQEDYDCASIDSKEKKVEFLNKLVNCMSVTLGRPLDVNPKKVVSGSECEKTNALLQDLVPFVQGVTSGVGQQSSPPPPPPPEESAPPPPPPPGEDVVPPPPPPPMAADGRAPPPPPLFTDGGESLKRNDPQREAEKAQILQEASEFNAKIQNYGLNLSSDLTGATISAEIRKMELELKGKKNLDTDPSNIPPEKLEVAIQRQMDAIAQIKALVAENNGVIDDLVSATMTDF